MDRSVCLDCWDWKRRSKAISDGESDGAAGFWGKKLFDMWVFEPGN